MATPPGSHPAGQGVTKKARLLILGGVAIGIAVLFYTISLASGDEVLSGFSTFTCCVGIVCFLASGIFSEDRRKAQQIQQLRYVQSSPRPQMVTTQHSPPIPPGMNMQSVVTVLEQKKRDAELEAEEMRQQLTTKSASNKQMEEMKNELARLQESMADAENTKLKMQEEMEELRKSGGDSSLEMQDSVIGGDSMVGSTKIDSQIINDPEAIARAAIEAYRMAKNEEND
jgi:type IV secretory pathway VirB10-like protein